MSNHAPSVTPTRRTVVRSAAWAVPAISIVGAAPAFATSGPAVLQIQAANGIWTHSGANGVIKYSFTICNTGGTAAQPILLQLSTLPGTESLSSIYYKRVDWQPGDSNIPTPNPNWTGLTDRPGIWDRHFGLTLTRAAGLAAGTCESFEIHVELWNGAVGGTSIGDALTHSLTISADSATGSTGTLYVPKKQS